jgi:PHD/YefM family antitoxin component YafN of YafNO toxin-antitoxin module
MSITADTLDSIVPISLFNKGQASKIFDRLKTARELIVVKNNQPAAVLVAPEEYQQLQEAQENLYLLELAQERIARDPEFKTAIPHAEVLEHLGLTEEDVDNAVGQEIECAGS